MSTTSPARIAHDPELAISDELPLCRHRAYVTVEKYRPFNATAIAHQCDHGGTKQPNRRPPVDVDLFIKKMPHVVKELISREAFDNRRSINQEAIALLEEALLGRVHSAGTRRKQIEALLVGYADSQSGALAPAAPPSAGGPVSDAGSERMQ
jgi:hypothetical protein